MGTDDRNPSPVRDDLHEEDTAEHGPDARRASTGECDEDVEGASKETKTGNIEETKTGNIEETKTGNVEGTKTAKVEDTKTANVEETRTGTVEAAKDGSPPSDEDLPVIARMVVEIRSDGSRTIARGALEDAQRDEQVAIRAEGTTPIALAGSLTRALAKAPFLSKAVATAPYAAGRAAGRAVRSIRGLLEGDEKRRREPTED